MTSEDLELAWQEYWRTRTHEARGDLLVHYVRSLVRPIAVRMARGVPQISDASQDFISFGIFGLIDAIERYEPERGRFETYAGPRIRGAILDELRALDWVPRGLRSVGREVERAEEMLTNRLGRSPSMLELEEVIGPKARHVIVKLQTDTDSPEGHGVVDHSQDLESSAVVTDVVERTAEAVGVLDSRLKAVAVLVYVEGRTLTQVGKLLGVSESRVCQMQGQFLREFGKVMAG